MRAPDRSHAPRPVRHRPDTAPDGARPRARARGKSAQQLLRPGARHARSVRRERHRAFGAPRDDRARRRARGIRRHRGGAGDARRGRRLAERRPAAAHLRPRRQRQDLSRRAPRLAAARQRADSVRDLRIGRSHQDSRSARARRRAARRRRRERRPPLAPVPPADRAVGRRADARRARPAPRRFDGLLPGPAAREGEHGNLHRRRSRPPAHRAARPAQPLAAAARSQRRPAHVRERRAPRDAVRRVAGVLEQPHARAVQRRRVPAAARLEAARRAAARRALPRRVRRELRGARAELGRVDVRLPAATPARPHANAVSRVLSGRSAAARRGVRALSRRRAHGHAAGAA